MPDTCDGSVDDRTRLSVFTESGSFFAEPNVRTGLPKWGMPRALRARPPASRAHTLFPMPSSPTWKKPVTVVEWVDRLESLPHCDLAFLRKQVAARGHNGEAYDAAVSFLIFKKRDAGETIDDTPKAKRERVSHPADEEGDFVVTHVQSGPKGMTERVRIPRSLFCG